MKIFKFFAALMMAVVCVNLSSCKDDDENIDISLLVGTWIADDRATEMTFNDDGTGFELDENGTDKFTYTLNTKTRILAINYERPEEEGQNQFSGQVEINGDKLYVFGVVYTRKKEVKESI